MTVQTLHVQVDRHDDVAVLRIENAAHRNALSPTVLGELADVLETLSADDAVGCAVVTGRDDVFASGADLRWLHQQTTESMIRYGGGAWHRVRSAELPVVAAVRGLALGGGCELAFCCDVVVAAEDAVFALPEVGLGLLPGAGGSQWLARAVGRQRASHAIFTGARMSAHELATWGIVNTVVPAADVVAKAISTAKTIAAQPRLAVRLAKRAIRAAEEMPLTAALDYERRLFELAFTTADRHEGTEAFLERRPARFAHAGAVHDDLES